MSNNQILSAPVNFDSSLLAAIQTVLHKNGMENDGTLPAIVVSYDRVKNVATVLPIIKIVDVQGDMVSRKTLVNIPVLSMGAGNFHISFPIKSGDLGWIYACDRDITLFKQELKESAPNSGRIKTFADAMFVPDVLRNYTINSEDVDNVVIQHTSSNTRVAIGETTIKLTAPTKVTIDTPEGEATGNWTIDKDLIVKGNTTTQGNNTTIGETAANGGFTAAEGKACTLPSETTIANINVLGHGHEQNGDSGRTSGGMEE